MTGITLVWTIGDVIELAAGSLLGLAFIGMIAWDLIKK